MRPPAVPLNPFLRFLLPIAGFLFWAGQFGVIYTVTAVACARGVLRDQSFGITPAQETIGLATILAAALTLAVAGWAWKRRHIEKGEPTDRFLVLLTLWCNGVALVAILWNAVPPLILPLCA